MKLLKNNQLIIYIIVLMLMTAGYLSYTTKVENQSIETSMQRESSDDMQIADIGDATLVSSNDVVTEGQENETNNTENTNTIEENTTNNTQNVNTNNLEEVEKETVVTNAINANDYFIKSKLERDTMYSQIIETYEKILNSSNSLETQKQTATQEITKINQIKNSIMISENLIKTKGFENSVIFVNGESINVIVGAQEIKPEEVAQIQNIISREMNAKIENIHITNK